MIENEYHKILWQMDIQGSYREGLLIGLYMLCKTHASLVSTNWIIDNDDIFSEYRMLRSLVEELANG